ncbi:hypothetical protein BN903_7 [Halorubrum sp. AJ67]|nr:hypothetical protein BN903_7 [Halorubrum sp. AJ67]
MCRSHTCNVLDSDMCFLATDLDPSPDRFTPSSVSRRPGSLSPEHEYEDQDRQQHHDRRERALVVDNGVDRSRKHTTPIRPPRQYTSVSVTNGFRRHRDSDEWHAAARTTEDWSDFSRTARTARNDLRLRTVPWVCVTLTRTR